jgi:hypothetical protein
MPIPQKDSLTKDKTIKQEEKLKKEKIHDVLILLETLSEQEEVLIKMIIARLYEIGVVNIINKKVNYRLLNRGLKSIAKMSKPVAIMVGFYWFKRNCPLLITNWLADQVSFGKIDKQPEKAVASAVDMENPQPITVKSLKPASPSMIASGQTAEIRRLKSQVKVLTGTLVFTAAMFSAGIIWIMSSAEIGTNPPKNVTPSVSKGYN